MSQESRQSTLALSSWPYQTEIKRLVDAGISRDLFAVVSRISLDVERIYSLNCRTVALSS